jgi:hypothetical protein
LYSESDPAYRKTTRRYFPAHNPSEERRLILAYDLFRDLCDAALGRRRRFNPP